ncbi:uncharacterized protein [Narcine bancroftii]|uniref:uncharacterized protein n=1 Tax=Narcine bancroftii TaxID=1343680 RepID=UPI00383102F3
MEVADDPNLPASASPRDAERGLLIGGSVNGSDLFTLPALPTDSVVDSSSTAAQLDYRGGEGEAVGSGSPRGENPGEQTAGEAREGLADSSLGSFTREGTAAGGRSGEETAPSVAAGGSWLPVAGDPSQSDSGNERLAAEAPGPWGPGANGLELYGAEVLAGESCAPCNGGDFSGTAQGLEGEEMDVPGLSAPHSSSPGTWGADEILTAHPSGLEAASPGGVADPADELGPYTATESESGYPTDFEKYWKIVEDNPYDFTGWTYVLQYVEQENHIWAVRRAFDSFFIHYPYCYGYWKKYADIEKRFGFTKEAEEVSANLAAVCFSVRQADDQRQWLWPLARSGLPEFAQENYLLCDAPPPLRAPQNTNRPFLLILFTPNCLFCLIPSTCTWTVARRAPPNNVPVRSRNLYSLRHARFVPTCSTAIQFFPTSHH